MDKNLSYSTNDEIINSRYRYVVLVKECQSYYIGVGNIKNTVLRYTKALGLEIHTPAIKKFRDQSSSYKEPTEYT